jgi:cation transport ATPase
VFFVNACIVGGVVYAGVKTLVRRRPRKKTLWLATPSSQVPGDSSAAVLTGRMIPNEITTSRHLTTASVSLGLSMSGALFSMPLSLVSVPLTVYNALPIFERAWADLFSEGRLKMAMVQSVAVIGTLSTQHYVVAALITWLHYFLTLLGLRVRHFHKLVWRGLEHDSREFLAHLYGARPYSVWVQAQEGIEVEIPFEKLRVGDIVVVNEGDVVPVEGTVVEGTAEGSVLLATGEAWLVAIRIGDRVISSTMVMSGKMRIRVERL